MTETSPARHLTRHDFEVVIRRAAELEARAGSGVPEVSEADLLRIASEVGLSEENVRRALSEHYAETAGGALLVERGWAGRLCGPGLVSASRRIAGTADEVREKLESHFRTNESLRLVRRTDSGSLWEPEPGVVASIVRSLDFSGRGYQLAKKARVVEVQIHEGDDAHSVVTLTADLTGERTGWFWGLGVAGGGGAAVAAGVLITGMPGVPDLLALGTPSLFGISTWLARAGYRGATSKMRLVLEGLLDRLEHGESLEPPRASWRELLK